MNNGRVLLQQFLGVRSENAFLALKLHQLLVHKLDVALGDHCSHIGLIIIRMKNQHNKHDETVKRCFSNIARIANAVQCRN